MIVTYFTKERLLSIGLPEKISGRYWISDVDDTGHSRKIACVEGLQNRWVLRGGDLLSIQTSDGEAQLEKELLETKTNVILAKYRKTGENVQFFTEPATRNRSEYKKYIVSGTCRLNIGRGQDNQIVYDNQYVSSHHACLVWENRMWSITDTQSSNGTFVNQRRIVLETLNPGDTVYIMGLKIIVGDGFFAVNNPDNKVAVHDPRVSEFQKQTIREKTVGPCERTYKEEKIFRSPRFIRAVPHETIHVDSPPSKKEAEETPIALLLGPALTMGLTAIIMAAIAIINFNNGTANLTSTIPTVVMAFSMLCGTLLWPTLTRRNDRIRTKRSEENRQKCYREYLDKLQDHIYSLSSIQKEILEENCPSVSECTDFITNRSRRLWERVDTHSDFLNLRIGIGNLPLDAEIVAQERRFSVDGDMLQDELARFLGKPKILKDVPITCSLLDSPILGIVGKGKYTEEFVNGLLLQMTALHSHRELKLVFFVEEDGMSIWKSMRWLPHVYNAARTLRYVATDEAEVKAVSAALEQELSERIEKADRTKETLSPHYVIITNNTNLAEKGEIFNKTLNSCDKIGCSCIIIEEELKSLPRECSVVIELNENSSTVLDRRDVTGKKQSFVPESIEKSSFLKCVDVLANIEDGTQDETYQLPGMVTFLDMYGVGKTEYLNSLMRWKENDPVNSLEVPVGVSSDGEEFCLNLHEKYQGPHGLVAGMTGSGKSEFLLTYILSLAVNFHPEEVSFVLIDYKGGGLAGAFENQERGIRLPHLAGTITNLDGSSVRRSLMSIQSELRRRQSKFNEARKVSGEGTIDIYKYQKMYRNGIVSDPISHLFIIADEFAELKTQQPDFMEQLISAARIGRSLGVHLILATQKPSGVVDDQIWSNSRFRVCLKVQERADSMEMIKRPDAAALVETGRFYLQVGYNELFSLGQSAWSGAPYVPTERVEQKVNTGVTVIDELGRILLEAKPEQNTAKSSESQIVSIVRYLSDIAKEEGVCAHQLWLPTMPKNIALSDLRNKYNWHADSDKLEAGIGEYDDPFNQRQGLLRVSFTDEGNMLLYGTVGSGKTTILNTLLKSLLTDYDAEHLNVYIIDLGEETLSAFARAPQVGNVLLSDDSEAITNLFRMLWEEVEERKKLYASFGGNHTSYQRTTGNTVPGILVVIRNYSAFSEQFEELGDQLQYLTREGNKYGLFFLMTANSANAVRYRIAQNFTRIFALQLNDRNDYYGIFGNTDGVYPSNVKGRGIFRADKVYEFQAANIGEDGEREAIGRFCEKLSEISQFVARPVPVLPDQITAELFDSDFSIDAVPIGVEKGSLRTASIGLSKSVISLVLAQDVYEIGTVAQGIADIIARLPDTDVTVWDAEKIIERTEKSEFCYYDDEFSKHVENLFEEMVSRNNRYKEALQNQQDIPKFKRQVYIITGFNTISSGLSDDGKDKLQLFLEKAEVEYLVHFILCSTARDANQLTGAAWYKRHISGTDAIWVGNGVSDQYVVKINRVSNDLYAELEPYMGYVIRRGKPRLVKLICSGDEWEK